MIGCYKLLRRVISVKKGTEGRKQIGFFGKGNCCTDLNVRPAAEKDLLYLFPSKISRINIILFIIFVQLF